jgi:hypothetical protein
MGAITYVVGQLDCSCDSHSGPFYHSVDDANAEGPSPLEKRSAGID